MLTHHEVHEGHEGFGSKGGFETRPYNFVLFVSFVVKYVFYLRLRPPDYSHELSRVGDHAFHGGGGGHRGAAEVNLRLVTSHASLEVAVRR